MSEARTPDGLLLRRYREGDEAAFAELRRRYERIVLATCRRETGDAGLAEDAAQGAFLLLTRKSFRDDDSLAGWLHTAARLTSRNLVRGEARRRSRERRAFEEATEPDRAWEAVAPEVDAALSSLKGGDREAVLLRFAGELSLAEVGAALGIGEDAARMRIARALERMRAHLRRAGVGITAALLASLLSTRLADAEAPLTTPRKADAPAPHGGRAGLLPVSPRVLVGVGIAGLGGISVAWLGASALRPRPLPPAEAQAIFGRAAGAWRGTLEFADDATGQRTRTAVNVQIDRPSGGLRFVATYPAFRNVDTTTLVPTESGRFRIENGGAGSSHRLDGLYEAFRTGGGAAFVGQSAALNAEVRLTLRASDSDLTLQEEYRRGGDYRFRNRFELTR